MTHDISKSYEMSERAERVIPGGIHGTRSPRFRSFGDFPTFLAGGSGCKLTDVDGNEHLLFDDDPKFKRGRPFSGLVARRGAIFHPRHNWFISAAHTPELVSQAVRIADECFGIVAKEIESGDLP